MPVTVWRVAQGFDPTDRVLTIGLVGADAAPWLAGTFRFGVPGAAVPASSSATRDAAACSNKRPRDSRPSAVSDHHRLHAFREAGQLLYAGPWVAERLAGLEEFLSHHPADVTLLSGDIIRGGAAYSAVDAYRAAIRLEELKRDAARQWARMDVLLLPTAGTIYTKADVEATPSV